MRLGKMRSCSLILSLTVILLMLVTMNSFAIAACPAPTCYAAPACSARSGYDCNCISQPTQAEQKMAQVALEGIWDRFPTARTVQQMMDTLERIMEDPSTYPLMSEEGGGGYRRGRNPWGIKEGENEYKRRFDVPGMTKKDVKVWVEGKMLVFKAEKQAEEEKEWPANSYGKHSSRIALPENIEMEKIKAVVKDGVLYISIPKADVSEIAVE